MRLFGRAVCRLSGACVGLCCAYGIGIQFGLEASDNFGLSGIDLDHVVCADGTLEPFAEEIVQSMNSYTEYSPSGTGLHVLVTRM